MASGQRTGGRRPGTPNKTTVAIRERIESLVDPIGFLASVVNGEAIPAAAMKDAPPPKKGEPALLVLPTLDQRMSAARLLADKMLPNARDRPIVLKLPPLEAPADLLKAQAAIVAAMARGEITPEEASTVAGVVELKRRAVETVELERRIAALEEEQTA